jgi:hypothetical protein
MCSSRGLIFFDDGEDHLVPRRPRAEDEAVLPVDIPMWLEYGDFQTARMVLAGGGTVEPTLLERRTIEAEALEPVLKAFIEEPGREKIKRTLFKAGHETRVGTAGRWPSDRDRPPSGILSRRFRSRGPGMGLEAPIRLPDGFQGSADFLNLTDALVRRGDADAGAGQITGGA